jgi:hypothetical protein
MRIILILTAMMQVGAAKIEYSQCLGDQNAGPGCFIGNGVPGRQKITAWRLLLAPKFISTRDMACLHVAVMLVVAYGMWLSKL